jgi:Kdo2-lipid IVA lauroyltransferase/acyltransferase
MKFRHWIEYAFAIGFCWGFRLLPRNLALQAGALLGQLAWNLGIRKNLVLENLTRVFPELSDQERHALAARSARNFGRTVAEYARLNGHDQNCMGKFVEVEGGGDALTKALAAGNGALIVTGHLGAWALYMGALQLIDVAPALLVGRHHNPKFDQLILNIPGKNVQFISKGPTAPRHVLKCLKENRAVVMVADQRSSMGLLSSFLGHPAMSLALPGAIIAKHRVPLFLLDGHRVSGGKHKMVIRVIEIPTDLEGEELRQVVTDRCNQAIGETILKHPDQYFWYHRRWRI